MASGTSEAGGHELRGLDRVVVRLSRVLVAYPREALSVGGLSNAIGVSERPLRRAVQAWYGLPPKQLLRARRLCGARRALEAARPGTVAVTEVAHA